VVNEDPEEVKINFKNLLRAIGQRIFYNLVKTHISNSLK